MENNNIDNAVIYVGGIKGGTGKSFVSMLVLHYFINQNITPTLLETDTSNPDVFKSYSNDDKCNVLIYNIDDQDYWYEAMDKIAEIQNEGKGPVVINSAARNLETLEQNGETLNEFKNFVTLWPINTNQDCLNHINKFIQIVKRPICIIKNGKWGKDHSFKIFNDSDLKKKYGLQSVYLPILFDKLIDMLYNQRLPYHQALEKLQLISRAGAQKQVAQMLQEIDTALHIAQPTGD